MNIYAQILIDEAQRRGINIEILDGEFNLFALSYGEKRIVCRESLTEKTSAIAIAICDNKSVTHRQLQHAGLAVPQQKLLLFPNIQNGEKISVETNQAEFNQARKLMEEWERVVIKPAQGEQGQGITVDVSSEKELRHAIALAQSHGQEIIVEEYVQGHDVRMIVINHQFVAAIERKPATIVGDGEHSIKELVYLRNKELLQSSQGESQIPISNETGRVIQKAGCQWSTILPRGSRLQVCKTANYHTGGCIFDITDAISTHFRQVAEQASKALSIPVVGLDFIIPDLQKEDYVIIEANERPGLANHEPQPTAQRFIDFLFPETS